MNTFEHTVATEKPFEETVVAIEKKAGEKGFRVLHTHDVAATLAEKGYRRKPLKIIEICNAKYASQVLSKDVKICADAALPDQCIQRTGQDTSAHYFPLPWCNFSRRQELRAWPRRSRT